MVDGCEMIGARARGATRWEARKHVDECRPDFASVIRSDVGGKSIPDKSLA